MRYRTKLLLLLLCACLLLGGTALAAQDITDWVNEYVISEVSNIPLYEASNRFALYGELLYNDLSARCEFSVSGEGAFSLRSVALADAPTTDDGESFSPPAGYVLVTVSSESHEDVTLCMPEEFAQSPAERRAEREAAAAADADPEQVATETPQPTEGSPAPDEQPFEESASEPAAKEQPAEPVFDPAPSLPPQTKGGLSGFLDSLEQRDYIYIILLLVLLLVVLLEAALLIVYRRRAENVARSYIRGKKQLEQTKRSLSVAKGLAMQKDRELIRLRDELAALSGEYRAPERSAAAQEDAEKPPASPSDYEYKLPDYEYKF